MEKNKEYVKMLNALIDDDLNNKLQVFDYLDVYEDRTINRELLRSELKLSAFLSEKYLYQLNEDIVALSGKSYFSYDANYLYINELSNLNRKELYRFYLSKSIKCKILAHIFLKEFTTLDYSMKYYISQSKVYKELQKLKYILSMLDITLTPKFEVLGDRETIEMLMIDLYKVFDAKAPSPYRIELANLIKKYYGKKFSQSFIYNCEVYMNVIAYSMFNGHYIEKVDFYKINNKQKEELQEIFDLIIRYFPRLQKESQLILATNLLTYFEMYFAFNSRLLDIAGVDLFITQYITYLKTNYLNLSNKKLLEIENSTMKYLGLSKHIMNDKKRFTSEKELHFLENFYPVHYQIVQDFFSNYQDDKQIKINNYLLVKMIIILITKTELKDIVPVIKICIDVRGTLGYNESINKFLTPYLLYPTEITWNVTNETQLIITDHPELYDSQIPIMYWETCSNTYQLTLLINRINYYFKKL